MASPGNQHCQLYPHTFIPCYPHAFFNYVKLQLILTQVRNSAGIQHIQCRTAVFILNKMTCVSIITTTIKIYNIYTHARSKLWPQNRTKYWSEQWRDLQTTSGATSATEWRRRHNSARIMTCSQHSSGSKTDAACVKCGEYATSRASPAASATARWVCAGSPACHSSVAARSRSTHSRASRCQLDLTTRFDRSQPP